MVSRTATSGRSQSVEEMMGLSTDRKARLGEARAAHLCGKIEKWGPIIKAAGIKGE
jgi:hypothetical protein